MRLPQRQLDAVKAEAKRRGIPYQRLMRELLETGLERLKSA
jgi:predicted DNA binding CopG/RHH family protein